MKNLELIKKEISVRVKSASDRGYFETKSQMCGRLLNSLSKTWYGYDGTLWSYRQYLIKYNLKEYRSIIKCIQSYYSGNTRFQDKGKNLDQFNFFHNRANGIQTGHINHDGRLPVSAYAAA